MWLVRLILTFSKSRDPKRRGLLVKKSVLPLEFDAETDMSGTYTFYGVACFESVEPYSLTQDAPVLNPVLSFWQTFSFSDEFGSDITPNPLSLLYTQDASVLDADEAYIYDEEFGVLFITTPYWHSARSPDDLCFTVFDKN